MFIPRNSRNILVKSVSFYLERFESMEKSATFWATLYIPFVVTNTLRFTMTGSPCYYCTSLTLPNSIRIAI